MIEFKAGDLVRLKEPCYSTGMGIDTLGRLVINCGHKRGGMLHFHRYGDEMPHASRGGVCRNKRKWEKVGNEGGWWRKFWNLAMHGKWTSCKHLNYSFRGYFNEMVCNDCGARE